MINVVKGNKPEMTNIDIFLSDQLLWFILVGLEKNTIENFNAMPN